MLAIERWRRAWARLAERLPVVDVLIGMSGWRLDRLNLAWIAGGAASFGVARLVMSSGSARAALVHYVSSLLFYYAGNTIILASGLPRRLIQRYGEERAYRGYETLLALMFVNQGLGLGAMCALGPGSELPIRASVAHAIGAMAFAIGLVVKVWATLVLGLDVYYYRDMFLGRPVTEFEASGPYKVFRNPMYGVGQLHAYGYALLCRSATGLARYLALYPSGDRRAEAQAVIDEDRARRPPAP